MTLLKFSFLMLIGVFSGSLYSQTIQANHLTKQETVVQFLDGFNHPEKMQASLDLLADDYKFKNPMIELDSKQAFIALAKEIGPFLTGVNLIRTAESGDWVIVFYEFKSTIPGLESNIATEWFRLEDGMIKESHLIYDATEWRKVYAQMQN
jgi:predicted SnoaL-like aldol condensation-catalyzing enzyme